jgi:hypothetical protein
MRRSLRPAGLALVLAPALLLADTPSSQQWVVTSAKVTGAGGNQYVTSLRIVNPNATQAPVDLYFFPQSADGSGDNAGAAKQSVTIAPNATLAIDDVIGTKFGGSAPAGGLRIISPAPASLPVWALSQTLVVNALSSTGVPGTNGFAIPAQSTDQLVANGETATIPYVSSSTSGSSGYRTNVFLLSANGSTTSLVTVALKKGDGTVLGSRDVTLARYGQTQINNIAGSFGYSANDTNLVATVTVKSGGPVATGASVIDNAIASISYSPPMKVAQASALGNTSSYGILVDDVSFGFSGRMDILSGSGDFVSMGIVLPSCAGSATLFNFQGFGPSAGGAQNTNFVRNADGTISFAGQGDSSDPATWTGTVTPQSDGSITGTVTYTRPGGAATSANPCPGVSQQYNFAGAKVFGFTP